MAPQEVFEEAFKPKDELAHQAVTLGAGILTLGVPSGAQELMFQAVTQNVRYTLDGSDPAAAVGFQFVASGVPIRMRISNNTTFRFFREAENAVLNYQFGD
jgi:hypothetical protein